jgi:outer membrane lipoprotein-sorting protein
MPLPHDALTRMQAADASFRTVKGVVEAWEDEVRFADAWNKYVRGLPRGSVKPLGGSPDHSPAPPQPNKRMSRVWMAKPWQWHVETQPPVDPSLATVVIDDRVWWLTDGRSEATTNEGFARPSKAAAGLERTLIVMVLPDPLTTSFRFETTGERQALGRSAFSVIATPTNNEFSFWPEADKIEMVVDAERGVILSWTTYSEGSPYSSKQFVEIEFDQPIAADVFQFKPNPGMQVRRMKQDTVS